MSHYSRAPRSGTRVQFLPNDAAYAMFYRGSPSPSIYEKGTVKPIAGPGGPMTSMRGPRGGLVYVEWDSSGYSGVFLADIAPAR
jgi:hypothetical protein